MLKRLILFSVTAIATTLYAQKPSDVELWTGGSFQLRVNKPLSFEIQEQIRFNDTVSTLYEAFTELGIKYRLGKGFSLKGNYRYIIDVGGKNDQRLAFDFNYGFDKKGIPIEFDYRLRFQNVIGGNRTYIRNKFSLLYKLSKPVDPFIAYEIFYRFNGKNEFRKSRFTVGLDWRLLKPLHLKTYYRIQDDIFVKNPERQHIIGILLDYTLKLKDKKKTSGSKMD